MNSHRRTSCRILIYAAIVSTVAAPNGFAAISDVRKEVFTAEMYPRLCPAGAASVAPRELAIALLGRMDDGVDLLDYLGEGSNRTRALRFFSEENPFAKQPPGDMGPKALAQRQRIYDSLGDFMDTMNGRPEHGYTINWNGQRSGQFVTAYFAGGNHVVISCTQPSIDVPNQPVTKAPLSPYRIRGKVDHLAPDQGTDKFRAASSASVAFTSNEEIDRETLEINGVVGYVLHGIIDDVADQAIPFVHYQSSKTTVSDETTSRLEVLNLGVLYDRFQIFEPIGPFYNFELGLRPTATLDLEQDAETAGIKAWLAPGMTIGNVNLAQDNDIFGSAEKAGWLIVYPDVRVIGEASYVLDEGTNPELDGTDAYAGIGVEPKLDLALSTGTFLDRLRLSIVYRYMKLFSAGIEDVDRFEIGLTYSFDEAGNFNAGLEYVDGENPDTFQHENYWGAKLGVKF